MHEPQIGDIYEYVHGSVKGKRVQLVDRDGQYFDTVVVFHPTSPQQVGYVSHVRADRLTSYSFVWIPQEGCLERSTTGLSPCSLEAGHTGPHKGRGIAGQVITWGYSHYRRPMRSRTWQEQPLTHCPAEQRSGSEVEPCALPVNHKGPHATAAQIQEFMENRYS